MKTDGLLSLIRKSGRYCGSEYNVVRKEWEDAALRLALVFPDLYEIGMSHQGLQILYQIVNQQPEYLAERAYAPDLDLEKLLRQKGLPLFSLESQRPLAEFDALGVTLPYELCYTNILTILELAGLPWRSIERDERYPLVLGGGPGAFHPEPVADFFDAILLGDGEEAILEICALLREGKRRRASREELLRELAGMEGVYVPRFYTPRYDGNGRYLGVEPDAAVKPVVRRRILPDLETTAFAPPLVPLTRIVHDRLGVEIARGCTRGCRFCQAGIIYRPVRERSPERVLELATAGIEASGFEELSLLSLSTGDYGCLSELLLPLMERLSRKRVSVSMPSMRVGTLTPEIMEQIKRVRKTGFTLAPEAGTDRLRRVINKGITEEDLLATCTSAFGLGWRLLKLYFMFGLPTETAEDLEAIPKLASKALATAPGRNCQISVSAATFVPKPHTVFEREPQLTIGQGFERIDFLKSRILRRRGLKLKWQDPRQSFLEGVMSRGDRRLSRVIEQAWRAGARLDAWSEHFRLEVWRQAAEAAGVDLDAEMRGRGPEEILPWQHLDPGLSRAFFERERELARQEAYTPDCRVKGCQECGLCDFKQIKPIVYRSGRQARPETPAPAEPGKDVPEHQQSPAGHFRYRLTYSRLGRARYPSHLEMMQMFFRAFRRLGWPLNYSQGFNPSPKVAFSPALPVGTESMTEYLVLDLDQPLSALPERLRELNLQLPEGFRARHLGLGIDLPRGRMETCYRINLPRPVSTGTLENFRRRESVEIKLTGKGGERLLEVRPLVREIWLSGPAQVRLVLASEDGKAGIKPSKLLQEIFDLSEEEICSSAIMKIWTRQRD